ncbi:hypothetical protein J7438_10975 [Thalassotalea sp. G20_0]|uniref:hypothetical protein n=1 Tax=Thalassotalea sp. G20_0 TaxID=2821093 RepID=UPI001ADD200A|nr:hypothetical protein [Thalassotalea sp. G20_0]MBO9494609.1 hypothetical protein [Thalassotalea sp. G20_0]
MDAPLTKPQFLAITYQPLVETAKNKLVETTEHPLAEKASKPVSVPGPREKDRVPEDFGRFYNRMVRPLERKFEDGLPKPAFAIGGRTKAEDKLAKSHMAYLQRKADAMQDIKPVIDPVVQTKLESPEESVVQESDTRSETVVMQDGTPALEPVPQTNTESSEDSSCGFFKKLKHRAIKVVKFVYKYTGLKFIVDAIKGKDKSETIADAVQSKDEPEVVADTVKSKDEPDVVAEVDKSKREPKAVADSVIRVLESKIDIVKARELARQPDRAKLLEDINLVKSVPESKIDADKARKLAMQPDRAKMLVDLKVVQHLRGIVAPITPRTTESSLCSGQNGYDLSGLHRTSTIFAEERDKKALENIAEIEKKRADVEAGKLKARFDRQKWGEFYNRVGLGYFFTREQASPEAQKAVEAKDVKMAEGHKRQDSQNPESETLIIPSTVLPVVTKKDPKADRYAAIRELDKINRAQL